MKFTGRCYCKKVRYEAEGEPLMRRMCHCRECLYGAGGGAYRNASQRFPHYRW